MLVAERAIIDRVKEPFMNSFLKQVAFETVKQCEQELKEFEKKDTGIIVLPVRLKKALKVFEKNTHS